MTWDGVERRKSQREFCEGHLKLCEDMAVVKNTILAIDKRINGSIDTIEKHIDHSRPRNLAIIAVLITVFIFLFNLAVKLGEDHKQIEINTAKLSERVNK